MADEIPVAPSAPATPPTTEPRQEPAGRVRCEFCECTLTKSGEVLRMSEKAKKFRDVDDDLDGAIKRAEKAESELANLKQSLEIEAGNAPARNRKGIGLYDS